MQQRPLAASTAAWRPETALLLPAPNPTVAAKPAHWLLPAAACARRPRRPPVAAGSRLITAPLLYQTTNHNRLPVVVKLVVVVDQVTAPTRRRSARASPLNSHCLRLPVHSSHGGSWQPGFIRLAFRLASRPAPHRRGWPTSVTSVCGARRPVPAAARLDPARSGVAWHWTDGAGAPRDAEAPSSSSGSGSGCTCWHGMPWRGRKQSGK